MEANSTESELESFRQRWKEEVSGRARPTSIGERPAPSASGPGRSTNRIPHAAEKAQDKPVETSEEVEGRTYHDLDDKEAYLTLENQASRAKAMPAKEPRSALEHYEKGVEREGTGNLGDSISHYRKAFKLDSAVQEAYKKKHYPLTQPSSRPSNLNPSNASVTVPNPAHHSLYGPMPTLDELLEDFSRIKIPIAPPETDLSPPPACPIANVPEEVIVSVLRAVGSTDVALFGRVAQVCKRLAYLIMTEDSIWKPIVLGSQYGFRTMHYRFSCTVHGNALSGESDIPAAPLLLDLTPSVFPNYRSQFRQRPRIRFNGCYISTVNYARPGGAAQSQFTWNNPVHIVTYYRYLRFFRDGTCISLLTTTEPPDTVHHLTKENLHRHHTGALPSSVMKDALHGRWRLSGSHRGPPEDEFEPVEGPGEYSIEPSEVSIDEEEGELHIETEGVIPKYMWKMNFSIGSSGRKDSTRNNKLSWKGFWSYNRLTDDWGEFGLKNDRAFYWSRVKSYTS